MSVYTKMPINAEEPKKEKKKEDFGTYVEEKIHNMKAPEPLKAINIHGKITNRPIVKQTKLVINISAGSKAEPYKSVYFKR